MEHMGGGGWGGGGGRDELWPFIIYYNTDHHICEHAVPSSSYIISLDLTCMNVSSMYEQACHATTEHANITAAAEICDGCVPQ